MHGGGEKDWRQILFLLESDADWQRMAPVFGPHLCHAEGIIENISPKVARFKCRVDWTKQSIISCYLLPSEVLQPKKKGKILYPLQSFISLTEMPPSPEAALPLSPVVPFWSRTPCEHGSVVTAAVRNPQSSQSELHPLAFHHCYEHWNKTRSL